MRNSPYGFPEAFPEQPAEAHHAAHLDEQALPRRQEGARPRGRRRRRRRPLAQLAQLLALLLHGAVEDRRDPQARHLLRGRRVDARPGRRQAHGQRRPRPAPERLRRRHQLQPVLVSALRTTSA